MSYKTSLAKFPDKNDNVDASAYLVHYLVNMNYIDLPPEIINITKMCILDVLGVSIAASTLDPVAGKIADLANDEGGKQESTILGFGFKVPCRMAAFANGAMGHMMDFDDVHDAAGVHAGITTVLPALAIAEKLGNVSGKDLILAVALGNDIIIRLGKAITLSSQGGTEWSVNNGWMPTQLFGYYSGTAAIGKLLKLNEEQMMNALGIAFSQTNGSLQMGLGFVSDCRAIQVAWTGEASILSALLAQRGITGARNFLEGKYGLYNLYLKAKPHKDSLIGDLGSRFDGIDIRFKVWPACAFTNFPIYSVLKLMQEHHISPDKIEEIRVIGGPRETQVLFEPLELKRNPHSSIEAKFSIPFGMAVAVIKGNVMLKDFAQDSLRDPAVLEMAKRISYHRKTENEIEYNGSPKIEIRTTNKKIYKRQDRVLYGYPENPVHKDDIIAKFRDCISFSAKPVPKSNVDKVISMVEHLEDRDNVNQILQLLD